MALGIANMLTLPVTHAVGPLLAVMMGKEFAATCHAIAQCHFLFFSIFGPAGNRRFLGSGRPDNADFWGSGRPRGTQKPFQKVGGRCTRSENAHSNSNRPGSAESGPMTITMGLLGPVGPIFGPTGPNISIVLVFESNRARPGPLLLPRTFSLRRIRCVPQRSLIFHF